MLTKWGVDVAEQLQVPIYLEAAAGNAVRMYERQGFYCLKPGVMLGAELMEEKEDIEAPIMVRLPTSAAGQSIEEWVAKARATPSTT